MSSIDNRIVNMQFNNRGFESGVSTTLNSLKKLNDSLKMKDASKGLTDISDGLNKVNGSGLSGLSRGVEAITSKFSALGIVATTALVNITNRAVNAGMALAKSLTIEPVMDGFREYELKMDSIQTILTNTAHAGTTLEDVTKVLDELNKYADLTIYNFADMTDNISKFTAAGVDLNTSVDSIKGLANLAAASGVNATKASGAMYQLSQALAAGRVSLMDWMSIEKAGMGGKLFQDALIRTSENLGTGADAMIKKYGTFRESLTKGQWLTTEVLTETLKQIAGAYTEADLMAQGYTKNQAKEIMTLAQNATKAATEVKTVSQLFGTMKESVGSGWAQTWEHIIGNKDQAAKTLTAVKDAFDAMIKPSTDARNDMLEFWNAAGGRDDVIKGLSNIFQSIGKGFKSIGDAWKEVFPALEGKDLTRISAKFADFSKKLVMNDEVAKKIKDTFKGLFSVVKMAADGFKSVLSIFSSAIGIFGKIGSGALTVTGVIGKFFSSMYESLHASRIFENATNAVKGGLNSLDRFLTSAGNAIGNLIGNLSKLNFKPIFDLLKEIGSGVGESLLNIFEGIGDAIGNIDLGQLLLAFTGLAGVDIFKAIKDSFGKFGEALDSFKDIGEGITGALDSVKGCLESYQKDLNAGTLLKIASAIGILAVALLLLASIEPTKLESGILAMAGLLLELVAGMSLLTKAIAGAKLGKLSALSVSLIALAAALGIMALALKSLSGLSWDGIAKGLTGLAGSMLILAAGTHLMNTASKGMIKSAAAMVVMAAAMVLMAEAVKRFGELKFTDILQGLLGVGVVLAELGLFMKLTSANKMGVANAAGILILAAAIEVLQDAVAKFGEMDTTSLVKGLASLGVILLELAAFTALTAGSGGILVTAAAMVVLAGAINLMVPAITGLGNLSWEQIAKGLTSLAGSLTLLGAAAIVIPGGKLAAVGAGLAVMSAAMLILGQALDSLGDMTWGEIAKSLVTLAASLTIFAAAMAAMSTGLVGASAMLVMSAAMAIFTPQLIAMANLSWGQIAAGLVMLAGSFTVIGVAGLVLTPLAPVLVALAAAIALLGVGCLAAGAGVSAFAAGMGLLAGIGAAGGAALAAVLNELIKLLPKFAKALGNSLIEFGKAIADGIPKLAKAMGQAMIGILDAVTETLPEIIDKGTELVVEFCNSITENAPKLVNAAVDMIIALAEGLTSNIGRIVDAGVNLVVELLAALEAKVGELIQAGIDLGIAIIEGLADGITDNQQRIEDAMRKLGEALLDAFKGVLGIHSPSTEMNKAGVDTIEGLLQGITSKVEEVKTKMKTLAEDMLKAIKDKLTEWYNAGKNTISNLAKGISEKASDVKTRITNAITEAYNNAKAKVSQFLEVGRQSISNIIKGIQGKVSQISSSIGNAISKAKQSASKKAAEFKSIGTNIINGLKNGITSAASRVAEAARNVVQKAINAAKTALKIHSPSRVFMEIGNYTVQGFVKGLEDNADIVEDPAKRLARRAIDGVSNTISAISDALNGEVDTSLVITPVLDLTNVNNGVRTIRDMMAENNQFSMNADVSGAISNSIGNIQNGNNNEQLLQAIKDLKSSMTNKGTTYNINGITYDDGSNVTNAVATLVRAAKIERRI